ncbi:C-type lectin domain family 4 member E-like protein [Labeo rohita]|uniref:C-type lectin domain family 4 member E-like protein n=1 Tax=Labeo rohita TaxID=84645 RepID=A0A498LCQ2_LABRO|nr:C-type lectin domain family 4 member E-like protein [Labeo rohita]
MWREILTGWIPSTTKASKVACVMFTVLLLFSFLVIGIVTGLNFKKHSQEDQTRGLLSDDVTPIPFQYKGDKGRQNRKMYILYGILVLYVFILTLAVGIKSPCQENWVFYKDSCYFHSASKKNWQNAEKNCVEKGSHLVVVNNLAELDFLSSILKLSDSYWMGLVEKEEGKWTWVDGTDFKSTEPLWDIGQPDDWDFRVNGEDCGQLHARVTVGSRRLWNDADCTLSYPYICEVKNI